MILNKRLSYLVSTILYGLSLFVLYVFNISTYTGAVFGIFTAFFLIAYYISIRKLKRVSYLFLLGLVTFLFLYFFPSLNVLPIIIFILFVSLGFYLNLLALNIYNISEKAEKALPLLQAAKLVVFIAIILIVFLASTVIYKIYFPQLGNWASLFLQLIFFFLSYLFLFNSIMEWFFYEDKVGELKARNMLVSVDSLRTFAIVYLTQLSLVLMFTRLEDFGRGLFLAANTYVLVTFIQVVISRSLNRRFLLESLSILSVIYIIIYYL
jgi:hypothetical protein